MTGTGFTDEMELAMVAGGVNPGVFETGFTFRDFTLHVEEVVFSDDSTYGGNFPILPELVVHEGDDIVVSDNITLLLDSPVNLQQGMHIVIPIYSSHLEDRVYEHSFSLIGLYYIVDDHYILSAYEEPEDRIYSGMTVDQFNEAIRSMRNSPD